MIFSFSPVLISEQTMVFLTSGTLSYFNVVTAVMETVTADLPVSRTDTGKPKTSNPLINKQKNRVMTMKALEEAKRKADEGKYEEARQLLSKQQQLVAFPATRDEFMVQGMIEDLGVVIVGMTEDRYSTYGEHECISASRSQLEQRPNIPVL